MEKIGGKVICGLVVFGAFLLLLPSVGLGQITVNCPGDSLQTAIDGAADGTTISVNGTCNENITIGFEKDNLTFNGGGGSNATINGPDTTKPTVLVLSRYTIINGFTITGGSMGINLVRGATANIDGNDISSSPLGTVKCGIVIVQKSYAFLANNTIHNNSYAGVVVAEASFADIGVNGPFDPAAPHPNNIHTNGMGIQVSRTSSARIVGNIISNNTGIGILVGNVSHAQISSNAINGNGQHGIFVTQNSGVNLGSDSGEGIYDAPNSTTVNNGGDGLRCTTGGYADGRLGTLNGSGVYPTSFTGNCINSLLNPSAENVLGAADVPVPGDYDGDGITDIAVWRPSDGYWYILSSKDGSFIVQQWGSGAFKDVPVPGKYDLDNKDDIAVWRPGDGNWYILNSADGSFTVQQWGTGPN